MKINELTGIKNVNQNIYEYVESLGFKKIGMGQFGITFKGKKPVLKIFEEDDAYEHYIKLYKSVPNNFKHFMPKNNGVHVWPNDKDVKVIKLELLNSLSEDIREKFQYSGFKHTFEYHTDNIIKIIKSSHNVKEIIEKLQLEGILSTEDKQYVRLIIDIFNFLGFEFLQFTAWLHERNNFFKFDLHSGNIMQRTNNELVLIDPWYE